ncbi:MAG TPA: FAD-dependent oxidoreductase [Candidatus Desulfobacillus sp.]|nr:FAD-dependent oxidoreductase [Candidatus Desulfobacillus sp.]
MAVHEVRLRRSETVAEGTMAFHLSRPEGFTFRAGQSLLLGLIDPPETDSEGDRRTFTIASAPHEGELMVATRMRDTAFKRVLKSLPAGAPLTIDGPNGTMVLEEDGSRQLVFLAGGIGITPFRSMILHAAHERLPHRILLLYGNRRPEDAAFLAELQEVERRHGNFRLVALMSEPEKSARGWSGETGRVNRALVERHVAEPQKAIYYFAGPPPMTMAMHAMLEELGVAESSMRYEEFYGY